MSKRLDNLRKWVRKNKEWLEIIFALFGCLAAYIALWPIISAWLWPVKPKPIIPASAVIVQQEIINVSATEYWHDTGILVQKGDWLEFTATGSWWSGIRATGPDGAGGLFRPACGGCPINDGNLGELIGKVGDGPPFRIGSTTTREINQDGNLLLAMNESTGSCLDGREGSCYEDNNGVLEVKVTVRRFK